MSNNILTIKYLIDFLNDHAQIKIDKKQYLIDSYPILKIDGLITYTNLLTSLLISQKNAQYEINNTTFKVSVGEDLISQTLVSIDKYIRTYISDDTKRKKYINYISSLNSSEPTEPTNESILVLTHYFGINLLLYNSQTQIIKCYYYDNYLDRSKPFVVVKLSKEENSPNMFYELVFSQNKLSFDHSHPIIMELISNAFIVGLEQNKKLEYLENLKTSECVDGLKKNTDSNSEITAPDSEVSDIAAIQPIKNLGLDEMVIKDVIKLKMIPIWILDLLKEVETTNYNIIN